MEKELYKALASLILQNTTDQWGNVVLSPFRVAIEKWALDNSKQLTDDVLKKIDLDQLSEVIAKSVATKLSSSTYYDASSQEILKKMVMDKIATKLAEEQLEKLKNPTEHEK